MLELYLRGIVRYLSGDKELSKEYEDMALELHFDNNCIYRVEDNVPKQIKRKLYEMVS